MPVTVVRYQPKLEFEVSMTLMMMFFWVSAPCKLVGRCQRFGETYCLHLQPWRWRSKLGCVAILVKLHTIKFSWQSAQVFSRWYMRADMTQLIGIFLQLSVANVPEKRCCRFRLNCHFVVITKATFSFTEKITQKKPLLTTCNTGRGFLAGNVSRTETVCHEEQTDRLTVGPAVQVSHGLGQLNSKTLVSWVRILLRFLSCSVKRSLLYLCFI
jgi:hypothetical protein